MTRRLRPTPVPPSQERLFKKWHAPSSDIAAADAQKALLVFFQNKAGQAPGRVGGRVYSNPIGANLWDERRRVTMHDQFSVLYLARQKRVADGQQIAARLAIERHP